ncbi:MAG: amidase family protein, partial [Gaiellaceae bacterium]
YADEYGENVRTKLERCLAVEDADVAAGAAARRAYREQAEQALTGVDLLVTPTIGFVAPPDDVDELTIRERGIRFTYPFDSLGWPALALPCGAAEDGLPASVQIVGRAGDDELVLAAGGLLASLVRGTAGV